MKNISRKDFIKNTALASSIAFLPPGRVKPWSQHIPAAGSVDIPAEGAHVVVTNGIPDLYIDGKKASRMWGRLALPSDYAPEKLEQYRGAGIDVYFTALDTAISLCWDGEDEYYFDKYEAHVRRLVTIKPDIRLILYVGGTGGSPYRWCKKHPEELTKFSSGIVKESASVASEIWKKDSSKAFSEFVRYFSSGIYNKNVIGFNPVYNANEWFSHHREVRINGEQGWPDFSKPMLLRFRSWLRERYGCDVTALRDAWNDNSVTFETAEIPTVEQRKYDYNPTLFLNCTTVGNRISDYYRCYDEALADLSIAWCKIIKEASEGKKLAGMMNGYSYCGRYDAKIFPQHHGHGYALKVIDSPHVDFLHSPFHYLNRSVDGTHYSQHAADSIIQHGKLMVDQIDVKPHLRKGPNHNASNPWESEQILKRDVMYSISKNCYCYWLEGGPGNMFPIVRFGPEEFGPLWFDDSKIKATIAQLKKLSDDNQGESNKSVSEVAIFTSMEGTYHQKMSSVYGALFVEIFRQWIMPHTGVQFDDYIMEDIPNIKKKYKVCIFMDTHYMNSSLRKQIKNWLNENSSTALWFYAPAYMDEKGCSPGNTKELTGIDIGIIEETAHSQTEITDRNHLFIRNSSVKEYGTDIDPQKYKEDIRWLPWPYQNEDFKLNPVVYAQEYDVTVIGRLKGSGKPSLVVKDFGNRKSVYSASPLLPAPVIRNILENSGVHLYSKSGELVLANEKYISISAISGEDGKKTVFFPQRTTIYDTLKGDLIARDVEKIDVNMKFKETRIFKTV